MEVSLRGDRLRDIDIELLVQESHRNLKDLVEHLNPVVPVQGH
jgi:hypothetical protein